MPAPQTTLGVHLLETITLGMYSEPRHCVREYVQNAYDSIREARRSRALTSEEGRIDIVVDPDARALRIRDDGTGLDPEQASVQLIDIGYSTKARTSSLAEENAGFRGIGRMAGLSYCQSLAFETTDGGGMVCRVAFDAAAIKRLTRPGQKPETIENAINRNCTISELPDHRPLEKRPSFFEVSLEGVNEDALLDPDAMALYLAEVAPVGYDRTVWKFQEKVRSFASSAGHPESLDVVTLCVCGPSGNVVHEVYRPFRDSFTTTDGQGKRKRRVDVSDVDALPKEVNYPGWWGWLGVHKRAGALAGASFRGLRIRMHNIAVGDHSIIQSLWTTANHALWCFGEIHIVDGDLVPNSQRDNFEPSQAWDKIRDQISDEVRQIDNAIRRESRERNESPEKVARKAQSTMKGVRLRLDEGLTSHNEKKHLLAELQSQSTRVTQAIELPKRSDADRSLLRDTLKEIEAVVQNVDDVARTDAEAATSHLNRQAKKAVRTVLDVVREVVHDDKLFATIEEQAYEALRPGQRER